MMDFYHIEHQTPSTFPRIIPHSYAEAVNILETIVIPRRYLAARRALETACVLAAAPLCLVLCLAIALVVRIDSRGPVLFRQQRPGRDGRLFEILKFRTMRIGDAGNFRLTQEADERITRIGRFLRRHRFDEIPQLWHVLTGEMSIIGPRPDPVEQAEACRRELPLYPYRQMIRPGITGWAQVHSGYAHDVEATRAKLDDDLYYIANISAWLDAVILARTIRTVLTGAGAR